MSPCVYCDTLLALMVPVVWKAERLTHPSASNTRFLKRYAWGGKFVNVCVKSGVTGAAVSDP